MNSYAVMHLRDALGNRIVPEEVSIQKKLGEKKLFCMCPFSFHLLVRPDRYQSLRSHAILFFATHWKMNRRGSNVVFCATSENCHRFAPYPVDLPATVVEACAFLVGPRTEINTGRNTGSFDCICS